MYIFFILSYQEILEPFFENYLLLKQSCHGREDCPPVRCSHFRVSRAHPNYQQPLYDRTETHWQVFGVVLDMFSLGKAMKLN